MSHTPGPWEVYGSDIVQGPLEWGEDGYLVVKRPVSIAKVWKFPYVDERQKRLSVEQEKGLRKSNDKVQAANLALIAAAPDMLAMLEELHECAYYWSEYDVPLGIVERLDETIRKARGNE